MKERDSNIELLRLIAMFSIVLGHYSIHGIGNTAPGYAENGQYVAIFNYFGNLGVNLFVLISGFYMITSKLTFRKVISLLFQVSSYSILLFIFAQFFIFGNENISIADVLHYLFPTMYGKYWFISTYVQLILISPFLNQVLNNSSLKNALYFIITCLFIILYFRTTKFPLLQFILLYSVAAIIRRNLNHLTKFSPKACFSGAIALCVLFSTYIFFSHICNQGSSRFVSLMILSLHSMGIIIASLLCFLGTINLKIGYIKSINFLAKSTLAVYLIHEHPLMRNFIWQDIFNTREVLLSEHLYLHYFSSTFCIFFACIFLDKFKAAIIDTPIYHLVDKLVLPTINRATVILQNSIKKQA